MASAWTVSARRSAGWLGSVRHYCHTLLMGTGYSALPYSEDQGTGSLLIPVYRGSGRVEGG